MIKEITLYVWSVAQTSDVDVGSQIPVGQFKKDFLIFLVLRITTYNLVVTRKHKKNSQVFSKFVFCHI